MTYAPASCAELARHRADHTGRAVHETLAPGKAAMSNRPCPLGHAGITRAAPTVHSTSPVAREVSCLDGTYSATVPSRYQSGEAAHPLSSTAPVVPCESVTLRQFVSGIDGVRSTADVDRSMSMASQLIPGESLRMIEPTSFYAACGSGRFTTSPRPFPQPDPSPTIAFICHLVPLCRVLAFKYRSNLVPKTGYRTN